jgi:glycosyltransferase involved in cell wall biosynthesis
LVDGLVRRGHDVVLRASGDSATLAELRSVYPHSLRTAVEIESAFPYELVHGAEALNDARDFDIIHNHAGDTLMAFAGLADSPMLTTSHGNVTPDSRFVWDRYSGFYNTISWSQAKRFIGFKNARFAGVVHNAIDVQTYPFRSDKEDYLLCLARVSPEKGIHLAIEVARRLSMPLVIAGKVDRVDREYFETTIEPLVDGLRVRFFGEANAEDKRELYANARCLLVPICWEEPFGLVMPEAMACGTPVVAFARGAAPEIVLDGETGFLVDDVDQMVEAVRHIRAIDPKRCRSDVEERFDVRLWLTATSKSTRTDVGGSLDRAQRLVRRFSNRAERRRACCPGWIGPFAIMPKGRHFEIVAPLPATARTARHPDIRPHPLDDERARNGHAAPECRCGYPRAAISLARASDGRPSPAPRTGATQKSQLLDAQPPT